jgi:hypothetical protein
MENVFKNFNPPIAGTSELGCLKDEFTD